MVDDAPALLRVLARHLVEWGWEPVTVASGEEALERLAAIDPDVVLLDLGLPDIDGMAVLRALKSSEETAWVPVVILSGAITAEAASAALLAGAQDIVAKPFHPDELLAHLTSASEVAARHRRLTARHAEMTTAADAFQRMAAAAPDIISVVDEAGTFQWISPTVTELLGWHPSQLVGTSVAELIHPEDFGDMSVLDRGDGIDVVLHRLKQTDGVWRWCESTRRVITDPVSGRREVQTNTRDAQRRVAAQAALEVNEARYRELVDRSPEGIWALDADGKVSFANPAMAEILGWPTEQMVGRPVRDFIDPEDHHVVAELLDRRRQGVAEVYEQRFRHRSGRAVWAAVNAAPVFENGRFTGAMAVMTDITARRDAEHRLARSEARYRGLVDHLPESAVVVVDRHLRIVTASGPLLAGQGPLAAGDPVEGLLPWAGPDFLLSRCRAAFDGMAQRTVEVNGPEASRSFLVDVTPLDRNGSVVETVMVVARDVTALRRESEARERAESDFRIAFESAPVGMAHLALSGTFLRVNQALCDMLGYARDELVAASKPDFLHPDEVEASRAGMAALASGAVTSQQVERRCRHADGHTVWVSISEVAVRDQRGRPAYFLAHLIDITERKRAEARLQELADQDPLTGLANRRSFEAALHETAAAGPRSGALLMLDLDHFKQVNDTLGHAAGDELIVAIAGLLRRTVRESDLVARIGGDEFAVILPRAGLSEAKVVAAKIIEAVRANVTDLGGQHRRTVTTSVGIAMFDGGLTGPEVLVNADLSMYDAKEAGRDQFSAYRSDGHEPPRTQSRLAWVDRIRTALDDDRFTLMAQPIVELATGEVTRYELLLRMVGDDGSLVRPAQFLDIAERFGMVGRIDRWVTGQAALLLADPRLPAGVSLEVNLSALSLGSLELLAHVESCLAATGADPGRLVFEITETAAVGNIHVARAFADRLSQMGCRFALDDFGAGFGSFYYLKHLPFDYIKIDGEFITNCTTTKSDRLVIESLVTIARGLDKKTIAEFVEDGATLAFLRDRGVDYAQGLHVGEPVPLGRLLAG